MGRPNDMNPSQKNALFSLFWLIVYTVTYLFSLGWDSTIPIYYYAMSAGTALLFICFLRHLKPIYYFLFMLFTVMAQYFGSMLGGYHAIWFYDLILHFSSGFLLVLVGNLLYRRLLSRSSKSASLPKLLPVLFSFFLSVAFAGLWEIYEFCGDFFFNLQAQGGSLLDTMTDIIAGSIGAVVGAFSLWLRLKKQEHTSS